MQNTKTFTPKHIEISEELVTFLTPNKEGYSRCDAFHDLVVRAISFSGQITYKGTDLNLMPGEFVVTVSELSKLWGWERRTVRTFIRKLQDLEMLQVIPHMKFYQVDMVALRFKWLGEDNPMLAALALRDKILTDSLSDFLNDPDNAKHLENSLSGSSLTNAFVDSMGKELYTSQQRIEVATALLHSQSHVALLLLLSLYSPKVEKSMLDTYYKRCAGNGDDFEKIIKGLAKDLDKDYQLHVKAVCAEILTRASEMLSDAFKDTQAVDSTPNAPKAKRTRKTKPKQ